MTLRSVCESLESSRSSVVVKCGRTDGNAEMQISLATLESPEILFPHPLSSHHYIYIYIYIIYTYVHIYYILKALPLTAWFDSHGSTIRQELLLQFCIYIPLVPLLQRVVQGLRQYSSLLLDKKIPRIIIMLEYILFDFFLFLYLLIIFSFSFFLF